MLNPALLLFLPLALVPIALHLITLHRLRTVDLPTFRFLMDSYVQQRRRVKLLEWLIMLLRVAFVAMVVFILSRPVIERVHWLGGAGGRDVVVIINAGASMSLRSGGTTSMERAKAAARSVAEHFGSEDRVTIIAADNQPRTLISRFAGQHEPFFEQIDGLQVGVAAGNLGAALREVFADDSRRARTVYVLSDGNRSAWSTLDQQPIARRIQSSGSELVVMDVGPTEPVVNLAVVGDAPSSSSVLVNLPVQLAARVVNSSDEPVDTVLSLVLDDQTVAQHNLSLQPRQVLTYPLTVTPQRAGVIRGRLELPGDAFPDDDAYLFSLNVDETLAVLIVRPEPQGGEHEDPALYIRTALEAPLHAHSNSAAAGLKQIAQAIDIKVHTPQQVNEAMLAGSDVVILSNVPLNDKLAQPLRSYITAGGGVLVMAGPNVDPETYGQMLFADALTLGYKAPLGDPDDESRFTSIATAQLDHPVLRVFADADAAYFGTTRLFRWFPIAMPEAPPADEPRPRVRPLMRLPDRSVVLADAQVGDGRVLLAGFAATPQWSNLPLKPEFVPLLLRSVSYLRQSPAAQTSPVVSPHQPAVLALRDDWSEARVQATDPAGRSHAVEMHRTGGQMQGAMLQTQQKGFYQFNILPRTAGAPEQVELGFAVNLDAAGLDFSVMDEPTLRELMSPASVQYVRSTADDPMLRARLGDRREIWRTLIWITFAIIGLEFLLSTLRPRRAPHASDVRIGPERAENENPGWLRRMAGLSDRDPLRAAARQPRQTRRARRRAKMTREA